MASTPLDHLTENLTQLVGILQVEDLEDPELASLLYQLVMVLEGEPELFPADLIDKISVVPDKLERFKIAAEALGAKTPEQLKELADSMKAVGLFK